MNARPVPSLSAERPFLLNEMFFSVTDRKGVIESGNEVFARISGFGMSEMLGKPHNIIRHPDMPRSVFAALWRTVQAGQPFSGYVKNRAKDGSFYWVFAVITPIKAGRFLSIRFKPTAALLPRVETVYRNMLAAEEAVLAKGGKQAEAITAGERVLTAALADLGHPCYAAFSAAALIAEIQARDLGLKGAGQRLFPERIAHSHETAGLSSRFADGLAAYARLNVLFNQLDAFVSSNTELTASAGTVMETAEEFRLHALNLNIAAIHCGTEGLGLSAVASFLGEYAQTLAGRTGDMRACIAEVNRATETVNSRVAIARLQMEMLLYFQAEFARSPGQGEASKMRALEEGLSGSAEALTAALTGMRAEVPRLKLSHNEIDRIAVTIELAQVRGLAEAQRLRESARLASMFAEFRGRLQGARNKLASIYDLVARLGTLTAEAPLHAAALSRVGGNLRMGGAT